VNADVARIAFVTRRFHELRGLIPASFGGALILGGMAVYAAGIDTRFDAGAFQAIMLANCSYVVMMRILDRRYRQTFGDVVTPGRAQFLAGVLPFGVMVGAATDLSIHYAGGTGPSAAAVIFTGWTSWIAVRDFRWRSHYVVAAAAGLAGTIATLVVPQAVLLAYMLIGLGLVGAGLRDHYLLAASLRSTAPDAQLDLAQSRARSRVPVVPLMFAITSGAFLWWSAPGWSALLPGSLMLAGLASQVVVAVPDALRAVREMHKTGRVTLPPARAIALGPDRLALLYVLAVAAVVEGVLGFRGALPSALAASMTWMAIDSWPHGKRFAVAAIVAIALVPLSRSLEPPRAFALLVLAISAAFTVESFVNHRIWNSHADTI
jgi:hypothetical protein